MLQASFTSRRLFFRLVRPPVCLTQRTPKALPYRTTTTDAVRKPALRGSRGVPRAPVPSGASAARIPARDPRPRDQAPAGRLRILCAGCGAGLQTRDHVAAGYIPTLKRLEELQVQAAEALARADAGAVDMHANTFRGHGVVCQRCFQAKHYGRLVPLTIPEATFAEYLAGLRAVPALILLVCDVFDFHATLLTNLRSLLEEPPGSSGRGQGRAASAGVHRPHDVIMVVNKIDLLPKATSLARLEVWVRTEARRLGLRDLVVGVQFASAAKEWGVRDLVAEIRRHRHGRPVYVVGAPNVGKSTVINSILEEVWSAPGTPAASGEATEGKEPPRRARPLSRRELHRAGSQTLTLFPDELPEGYRVGDVFSGDLRSVVEAMRARDTGGDAAPAAAAEPEGRRARGADVDDGSPANAPSRRLARVDGGGGVREAAAAAGEGGGSDAAVAEALLHVKERQARRAQAAAAAAGGGGGGAAAVTAPGEPTATSSPSPSTATTMTVGASPQAPSSAPPSSSSRAPVPFTTSPLPGTTLGVIGAPLDPHGHAHIYDTPGLVTDAFRQRMLEGLALRYGGDAAVGLRALAPGGRAPFRTVRLRPGRSLFLGGLARLAWTHPDPEASVLVTVCSHLPVHATRSAGAAELWERHHPRLGSGDPPAPLAQPLTPATAAAAEGVERAAVPSEDHWPPLHPAWGPLSSWSRFALRDCVDASALVRPPSAAAGAGGQSREDTYGAPEGLVPGAAEAPLVSYVSREAEGGQQRSKPQLQRPSPRATEQRRRTRTRSAVVDVVLPALGWLAVSPIEVEGMWGWSRTVAGGAVEVHYCRGVTPHIRAPLLPYEASGTRPADWLE